MTKTESHSLFQLVEQCLGRAIVHALPTIQKQAGVSTQTMFNHMFPQGDLEQLTLQARFRPKTFFRNARIEFRIEKIHGYVIRDKPVKDPDLHRISVPPHDV